MIGADWNLSSLHERPQVAENLFQNPDQNKDMKQQHCDYGFSLKRVWSCGDPVQAGNFRVNFNSSIREGGICFLRVYLSLHSLYTYGDVRIKSLK